MKPIVAKESFMDMPFPLGGLDLSRAYSRQPVRQSQDGAQFATTPVAINVRGFDPIQQRARGGSRPGSRKYISTQPGGSSGLIQHLQIDVGSGFTAPGGSGQSSTSGRVVMLIAVKGGNIYVLPAGQTSWVSPSNNSGSTPPLNTTGVVYSDSIFQKVYFCDGTHSCYYDPSTNSIETWGATSGSIPRDSALTYPRLICNWRGSAFVSGLRYDPHNWFMSATGDPTNWDYSPLSITSTQAVAGNNAPFGKIGDVVTSLIPYTDDVLFIGCDHSLWKMSGHPMFGGTLDCISATIGMTWGYPWCMGPDGTIYFFSNRMGIYSLRPGEVPRRISQQIDKLLQTFNSGTQLVRMEWNDIMQGFHVWISTTSAATVSDFHLFYEDRTGAWIQDMYGNANHNPLASVTFDGNSPTDRTVLFGSWDGYVRQVGPVYGQLTEDDDGTPIQSSVVLGPILSKDLDDMLLKSTQAVMGETSGEVLASIYVGPTAEYALSTNPVQSVILKPGRNPSSMVRRSGHAVYVKLASQNQWAMETIRATVLGLGKIRRRGGM